MEEEIRMMAEEVMGQTSTDVFGYISKRHSDETSHTFIVPRQYNFVHEHQVTLRRISLKDKLQSVYDDSESTLQILYDVLHGRRWSFVLTVKLALPAIGRVRMEIHGLKAEGGGYYSGMTYDLRRDGVKDHSHHKVIFHLTKEGGSVVIVAVGSDGLTLIRV